MTSLEATRSQFAQMVTHSNLPNCASFLLAIRMAFVFLGNRVVPTAGDPFPLGMVKGCVISGRLLDHSWLCHWFGNERGRVEVRHVAPPNEVAEVKLCEARVAKAPKC